jgi:hypothetical protein
MFGLLNIKATLAAVALTLFIGLLAYCNMLRKENTELHKAAGASQAIESQQSKVLLMCDKNTKDLKALEEKNYEDAKAAVEKAKKDAADDYAHASDIAHRKPKEPVVNSDNEKYYGGNEIMTQLKDYLATHYLANEEIERRAKGKLPQ